MKTDGPGGGATEADGRHAEKSRPARPLESSARSPARERASTPAQPTDDERMAAERRVEAEAADPTPRCELCGGPMLDRHCKLLCLTCGYQRDCSDP